MKLYLIFIFIAALLSGCSTTDKPTSLKELQARHEALNNEQSIRDNAAGSLQNTGVLVKQTENTWENDGEGDAYQHLHYLAMRSADITELLAEQEALEAQLATAKTRQQALKLAIEAEEHTKTLVLMEGDVLFGFDKARIREAADSRLEQLTAYLKKNPDVQVLVEGHTDDTGPATYNMQLSAERAEAVAKALQERGIAKDRIKLQAYGEHSPVASNDTEKGRQYNRRAEIIVPKLEE